MDHHAALASPGPRPAARTGSVDRRIGVEIEFLRLHAADAARALAAACGGSVSREDKHAYKVRGSALGDVAIDLDLRYVHPQRHPGLSVRLGERAAAWLGDVVAPVVPRELITAPMPVDDLHEVDRAVAALREAGARGDGTVFGDALSLHFNVAPPAVDAASVAACLKAFLLLGPGLREEISRGTRRLARVLPPDYPPAYVRQVLAPGYWPDLETLTDDYLAANPTRKRALDLLPILTYADEARVRAALPREKIGRRPVFHYRLPLSHVGEPGWSVGPDWERWLGVERLAADRDRLDALARAALA